MLLECDSPGAGTIDIGWSEMAIDGRPQLTRKGVSYTDRVLASKGHLDWEPIGFNAMRYVVVTFRGFSGPVRVQRILVRASQPELDWEEGEFHSSDERLNGVWELCRHTLAVGTQEGLMDCPSREQATYVGDGHPVAKWTAQLTGDARFWKYLVIEQFRRQSVDGMIRSSVFSGRVDSLIDYAPLGVMGTRDYYQLTGDLATIRQVIDGCRRVLAFFDSRSDSQGLFLSNWAPPGYKGFWEYPYLSSEPDFNHEDALNLFIDHPGMGWHNAGEAGINRRGINAAINALLVTARRALADLEEALGNTAVAADLRARADGQASKLAALFADASGLFHDGRLEGQLLPEISEQTNTWALAANGCDASTARQILLTLLTKSDPNIARNGPYFWTYLFPLLAEQNLHEIGCTKIRQAWGQMLDAGATTAWETFKGDNLDSWCHPWSTAPIEFLLTGILGLPAACLPGQPITLKPRFDLLPAARGRIATSAGPISISWKTDASGAIQLEGTAPAGASASLLTPSGKRHTLSGNWSLSVPSAS